MLGKKGDIPPVLSSYQIKTVLEKHAYTCPQNSSMVECILSMLTDCHGKNANDIRSIIFKYNISEHVLPHILLAETLYIVDFFESIANRETYDFSFFSFSREVKKLNFFTMPYIK